LINITINPSLNKKSRRPKDGLPQKHDIEERLLNIPNDVLLCPPSRYQCTFKHDYLTPEELEIYNEFSTKDSWEKLMEEVETSQLVFDWMKLSLKGNGPNSCVPAVVAIANKFAFGLPFDILNPLFYVELLVVPCETYKPRVKALYDKLNNIRKGAKGLAKLIKNKAISTFFSKTALLFKKPVDSLKELLDLFDKNCPKVSYARAKAQSVIQIMNHVGTASGVLSTLMDYYRKGICNSANNFAATAETRAARFGAVDRRMEIVVDTDTSRELLRQASIIETRTKVPTDVYNFMKDFSENVSPIITDLKATWDKVEIELEDIFSGIEDVIKAFAPFDEMFEIVGNFDCTKIPVLSIGKKLQLIISKHLQDMI
jgi:hypothetical protein